MAKILVSDLMGTLIPEDSIKGEYLYSRGMHFHSLEEMMHNEAYFKELLDKIFLQLGRQLKPFLEEGNLLKVISEPGRHGTASFMLTEMISRLIQILEEYKNQISIFFSIGHGSIDFQLEYLSKVADISIKDGNTYIKGKNGINAIFLENKTKVFDFIRTKYDVEKDPLFAIGDSYRDVPLLQKCIKLGGNSSFINQNLYQDVPLLQKCIKLGGNSSSINQNLYQYVEDKHATEKLLCKIANRRTNIKLEAMALEVYPDFLNLSVIKQEEIKELLNQQHDNLRYQEYAQLYSQLASLDINELLKNQEIYDILSLYYSTAFEEKTDREIEEEISQFSMYPTFLSYCDKVLYKK